MEIAELTGRELDAAVAERVMGWRKCGEDEPFRCHAGRGGCILDRGPMKFRRNKDAVPFPWEPSTDMNDAMHVLEKLRERFSNLSIYADNGWCCTFWHIGGDGIERNVSSSGNQPTAALAICHAALKAVESRP